MIDQPNKLYLGRETLPDASANAAPGAPYFFSARALTTHAICLGMTGTGKTGLGVVALEEALLQGIPLIVIDPKGDITNLALNFPELAPADFKPWLHDEDAARQRLTLDALAARTATEWKEGLAASDIAPERLRQLKDRAAFRLYTPGSDAGIPVNILQSLNPPSQASGLSWARNAEALRERIAQMCSALLQLIGIESDPLQGREHILLSTIFEAAWRAGQPVDLPVLIRMIQDPPVPRVGAFDMDVFYPKTERFALAMAVNNLIASPSFGTWSMGQSLDIAELIKPIRGSGGSNPAGRVPANIFYVAHLGDEERQFFVTLLLAQLVSWMRAQTGTSQLRLLVYFDETHGYCPPFPRNPPTKPPLMALVKQGRAAGLGLFLATQNPADLDYKGLSNIGSWFIGRLRTGRDRDRALEGLEGAGAGFDRAQYENALSVLPPRVFLVQSATSEPVFVRTRWAMSFLRGPLTRDEVAILQPDNVYVGMPTPAESAPRDPHLPDTPTLVLPAVSVPAVVPARVPEPAPRASLPPEAREVFLRLRDWSTAAYRDERSALKPYLLASARVRLNDRASGIVADERATYLLSFEKTLTLPDFNHARGLTSFEPADALPEPPPNANYDALPAGITARWLKQSERLFIEHVYRSLTRPVYRNATLKLYGQLDETMGDFRARCEAAARDRRDDDAFKIRERYERRYAQLQARIAREQRELSGDRAELDARKREETLTNIESIFNFVVGRRRGTGRGLTYGATKHRQTRQVEIDVRESQQAVAELKTQADAVLAEYRTALDGLNTRWMQAINDIQEIRLAPRKSDIFVDILAIAWA